ncbi:uncharacterized protein LOC110446050 isoform X2 [Mizuhopecten yessoensis]|uniref:uncharacterized protein LOC110446050 isoform X2 n=1 Tax=Mizuhopecten yessoensis TaxID=6573 RepID=UPI000B457A33|nr:uncharacterized protein LOC110446050 isoform X2 [Mizuhopecten yessoensis]
MLIDNSLTCSPHAPRSITTATSPIHQYSNSVTMNNIPYDITEEQPNTSTAIPPTTSATLGNNPTTDIGHDQVNVHYGNAANRLGYTRDACTSEPCDFEPDFHKKRFIQRPL